jgi:hypothetical protein
VAAVADLAAEVQPIQPVASVAWGQWVVSDRMALWR